MIHAEAGHTINAEPDHGGIKIVIECSEGVCETGKFRMSADEWLSFAQQAYKAMLAGGQ